MSILEEYFENAHISCLHYLVNRKLHWSERIFWLITLLMCMAGTYFVISTSIQDYSKQKTQFRVDSNYLDWDTHFPSVVICEKNGKTKQMERRKSDLFGLKMPYDDNLVLHALDMAFYAPPRFGDQYETCLLHPSKCFEGNFTFYMKHFRSNCTELLSYCSFNKIVFDCCEEFLPVETSSGICFGFNNLAGKKKDGSLVKTLNWTIPRSNANLTVEAKRSFLALSVLGPNAVPTTRNTRFQIADSGSMNFVDNSIHDIYVRVEDTLTLDADKDLSVERKNCRFRDENNLKYFDFYSESNCEIECYINAQKKYCHCAAHIYEQIPAHEVCNLTGILCTHLNADIDKYMDLCSCVPDCNSTEIFKVGYVSNSFGKKKMKWNGKGSTLRFNILLQTPTLRYIRYDVTTKLDLMVKIGGAVGFFLGCSFLSFFQIFYYFFVRFFVERWKSAKETKQKIKNQMLDENFSVAKNKLKMPEIESRIRNNLRKKARVLKNDKFSKIY